MKNFSDILISWYKDKKRDLPWRNTKDAYLIWLSEIILQQTRVEQGMSYYLKFAKEFPTVKHLAKAKEEKVLKLWQGLGYYSRARNLHASAKMVYTNYEGKFPDSYNELLKLKGVGEYTAAAIASFAFGLPHAVVDGNVFRVLSRIFGIKIPINSPSAKKEFTKIAQELLDKKNPALFNQAIMEFGSTYCKPTNPNCRDCIFNHICVAYEKNQVQLLPIKNKTIKQKNRYLYYIVATDNKNIVVKQRTENDIWKNLYDFPLIELKEKNSDEKLFLSKEWKYIFGKKKVVIKSVSEEYKHVLSHQLIHAFFIELETSLSAINYKGTKIIPLKDLKKIAVSRLIEKYIEKKKL